MITKRNDMNAFVRNGERVNDFSACSIRMNENRFRPLSCIPHVAKHSALVNPIVWEEVVSGHYDGQTAGGQPVIKRIAYSAHPIQTITKATKVLFGPVNMQDVG